MYPEKKGGSHKMATPQQNWGLLTLLTRRASIWTTPNTASPKSEPPCGRAVYTPVRATILGHPPQKTAPVRATILGHPPQKTAPGGMMLMWRHCYVINSYHIVMFVLLQGIVDIIVTSKYIWNGDREISQRMLMISVHLAHVFDCWTLVARKVSLTPCRDYDWLVCTL